MHAIDVTAGGQSNGKLIALASRKSPRTIVIEGSFLQTLSNWTVSKVRCALDEHEQGCFNDSAILADALLRDPQVFAHARTRVSALSARSGLPFSLEVSKGVDNRRADSVRNRISDLWWEICPEAEVAALQLDAVLLGVAVGRLDWEKDRGEWVPRLRRLRPSGLRWSEHEKVYRYLDGSGHDHIVTPGVDGWVLHTPWGCDSWLQGAVRALGIPWFARTCTLRDWLRFSERHGMPALLVEERFSQSDDTEGAEGEGGATEFYEQFRHLGKNPVIRLPQGQTGDEPKANARWLELTSTSFEGFERLLKELRREIISVLLGRDPESAATNVGGDGASVLERVRTEYLVSDAEALATTLRDQVLKPFVAFNVSPALIDLAPWPRWQTRPQVDLNTRVSTLNTAADALVKLETLGVDIGPVLEELHLTRASKPQPQPVAAPVPDAEPDQEDSQ